MSQPTADQHKRLARLIRQRLAAIGVQLGHSHALESVAALYGLPNWRTLHARPTHTMLPFPASGVALVRCLRHLGYALGETQLELIQQMVWTQTPDPDPATQRVVQQFIEQPRILASEGADDGLSEDDSCPERDWPVGLLHLEAIFECLPPSTWIYEEGQVDETDAQRMARAFRNERRTNSAYKAIQKLIGARLARGSHERVRALEQTFGIRLDHVYPWAWQGRHVLLNQPYDRALPTPANLIDFDRRYDGMRAAGWHVETSLRSIHYPGWTVSALLVSP